MTFDYAIELLEITDIKKISAGDLFTIAKKSKKRWHPDNVMHLNNPQITSEYTQKFQQIEEAVEMIGSFLKGTYHAGEAFVRENKTTYQEPEEIIRKDAPNIQATLRSLWTMIKDRGYKWHEEEVVLSDGFKLKEMLAEDFKEDIAILSVVSFFYGIISLGLFTLIAHLINAGFGVVAGIIWALQALSCFVGFLPLSRFWLPPFMQDIKIKFINFGLGVYHWAEKEGQSSSKPWISLLVMIPVLFAKLVKFLILFPLYELAKAFVKDKVVGVVKRRVSYYADAAEWYIIHLFNANPVEMTPEELMHLSYLYSELSDVKSKTSPDDAEKTRQAQANSAGTTQQQKTSKPQGNSSGSKEKPSKPEETYTTKENTTETQETNAEKEENQKRKESFTAKEATPKAERLSERLKAGNKKQSFRIAASIIVLLFGVGAYFLFFRNKLKSKVADKSIIENTIYGQYPQASQRVLSADELDRMNVEDLKIMRNEIYARYGFNFIDPTMKDYFTNQNWYTPTNESINDKLTSIEVQNISLIKNIENKKFDSISAAQVAVPVETATTESALLPNDSSGKFVYSKPCYIIVTGSYVNETFAKNETKRMRGDGYANAGYLWIPDYPSLSEKKFFATYLGPFETREECVNNLSTLRKTDRFWYGVKVSFDTTREEIRH